VLSSSVTIIAVSERLIYTTEHENHLLTFIHDHLESRSKIFKSIPVSVCYRYALSVVNLRTGHIRT